MCSRTFLILLSPFYFTPIWVKRYFEMIWHKNRLPLRLSAELIFGVIVRGVGKWSLWGRIIMLTFFAFKSVLDLSSWIFGNIFQNVKSNAKQWAYSSYNAAVNLFDSFACQVSANQRLFYVWKKITSKFWWFLAIANGVESCRHYISFIIRIRIHGIITLCIRCHVHTAGF